MKAVSAAFGGVPVWAVVGFWDIKIETTPNRTLILSTGWVESNIQPTGNTPIGITPEDLQEKLEGMTDNHWGREADGNFIAMLRHNGR